MKQSPRARRMARVQRRNQQVSKLNLVSLMDIFTILVFFLLLNTGDVEVLENDKSIRLPDSVAEQRPDSTLVVRVNETRIMVGSRALVDVSQVMQRDDMQIAELANELKHQAERRPLTTREEIEAGRAVTIMGDREIPYALLKRIMQTCAAQDYRNISLAVSQVPTDASEAVGT
ncbi:MAG TPA: biopolymer transporter ExbD [Spongiibacteraceae bacterium]|jgi:biopolymer transport protein ExbD|nr:biopolymer transporter ExbD [Spongiibacteraceae bacterium]HUH37379.1 biopolymer transporter ExbD [Spongiibacteraceae bacterium]